jgi:AraC-like DNA-binding protein
MTLTTTRTSEHRLGALRVTTHQGPAPYVLSGPEHDRGTRSGTGPALVGVGVQAEGAAVWAQLGSRTPCAPGDVFVTDPSRPWQLCEPAGFRLHLYTVPRELTGLSDDELAVLWGVHGRTGGGVAPLLAPLLTAAAEAAPTYPPHIAHGVAGSVVDLLGTLAAERRTRARASAAHRAEHDERAAMARRVRHFVNENLADRALSPEHIAARHHVSVRYLHKVFAAEGTTLSRWIRRRRLEECRRELARPAGPGQASLATVARRWGFANAAHFSRSFRAAYGVSPSEWHRLRAGAGAD